MVNRREHHEYRYQFTESFDTDLRYWVQGPRQQWRIIEADDRRVLSSGRPTQRCRCWLHVFERNPRWSGQFRIVHSAADGCVSWLIRYNHPDGAWVRVDYAPPRGVWRLIEQEDPGRPTRVLAEYEHRLDSDWHRFAIEANNEALDVSIDGSPGLSVSDVRHMTFGRIGFESREVEVHIGAIDYHGREGRPAAGVWSTEVRSRLRDVPDLTSAGRPFWALHMGVVPVEEGHLGILGYRLPHHTDEKKPFPFRMTRCEDGGGWEVPDDAPAIQLPDGRRLMGHHPQVVRLDSGEIIAIGELDGNDDWVCLASEDDGASWSLRGRLEISPERERAINAPERWRLFTGMQGKLMQTADGVLYHPATGVLWCSEDRGRTWELRCAFYPNNGEWGTPTQEHAILDRPDGTLLCFARDRRDGSKTLTRAVSRDGGRTWSEFAMNATPFVSSLCAFALRRDPVTRDTWYCAWTYNDKSDEPSIDNQPRTRQALAVSHDNGESWRFVCDLDDWGFPSYELPPDAATDPNVMDWDKARGMSAAERKHAYWQRDNRYCNGGLWIDERYVHFTVRRRFIHGAIEREDYCVYYVRIEKDKIETTPDFPGTRY